MAAKKYLSIIVVGFGLVAGCSSSSDDALVVEGDFPLAYVKRDVGAAGNPTDSVIFRAGGDLYVRDKSASSGEERNVTASQTQGQGDVSDPEVSYDGSKILFTMRRPGDSSWRIWEADIAAYLNNKGAGIPLRQVMDASQNLDAGNDVDPAYLPDGRIVFVSDRLQKSSDDTIATQPGYRYRDEYEREVVTALHVMDADGTNVRQISFNQSHDRNPTVLSSGEVMYSRWDHVGGRNQFTIFISNPDGTGLFVKYGAHSGVTSFLSPREMQNGKVIADAMPLSRTSEGGALMVIDINNFSEAGEPVDTSVTGSGQSQPTFVSVDPGARVSTTGRYRTPYPLWDGSNRVLVTKTLPRLQDVTEISLITGLPETNQQEKTPVYGIWVLDMNTQVERLVVNPPVDSNGDAGLMITDPIALMPRPAPNVISDKTLDPVLAARDTAVLSVRTVYDTDRRNHMNNNTLTNYDINTKGATIPTVPAPVDDTRSVVADIPMLKTMSAGTRAARFVRIAKAVPTPGGSGGARETIGETDFEMQQIVGYQEIAPDGSLSIEIPADTPVGISVIDEKGRQLQTHTSWIQARPGETRTCNGCHSPRRGAAINPGITSSDTIVPGTDMTGNMNDIRYYHDIGPGGDQLPAKLGQVMSETRVDVDNFPGDIALRPHPRYDDVWHAMGSKDPADGFELNYAGLSAMPTMASRDPARDCSVTWTVDCTITIDYPDHIQAIWNARGCTACHDGVGSGGTDPYLDLRGGVGIVAATGRYPSYETLMVGPVVIDPATGLPVLQENNGVVEVQRETGMVQTGFARGSRLVEVLSGDELAAAGAANDTGGTDHTVMVNASELRLISEWADIGGQYYNSPFNADGSSRFVSGLSEASFSNCDADPLNNDCPHEVLINRCGSCHLAIGRPDDTIAPDFGSSGIDRFVLTNNTPGDFGVTITLVNDVCTPANSYLLAYPVVYNTGGAIDHPVGTPDDPLTPLVDESAAVMTAVEADFLTLSNWIAEAQAANSCP
ncbi:MAG: hypothetical protein BMS9Abin36_1420 [Gammaproteobacteria bacterium]|nr:MAG: hypothetical protein BMS9Abin36_1420 [Gammaproteobacteria bacterium]